MSEEFSQGENENLKETVLEDGETTKKGDKQLESTPNGLDSSGMTDADTKNDGAESANGSSKPKPHTSGTKESSEQPPEKKARTERARLSLADSFPSLPFNNTSTPLLGIYFAAAWCPDSTEATNKLGEVALDNKDRITIVYCSSDNDEKQMLEYKPDSFLTVPFDKEDERADIKRFFGACGAKEVEKLNMTPDQRMHGLPTLIVLDRETEKILTTGGAEDVVKDPKIAVDCWMGLVKK
jgi:hypothetical protein